AGHRVAAPGRSHHRGRRARAAVGVHQARKRQCVSRGAGRGPEVRAGHRVAAPGRSHHRGRRARAAVGVHQARKRQC
ncbi:hypothetical protein CTI14_69265, partial [Methylobacterium radiotolerans]